MAGSPPLAVANYDYDYDALPMDDDDDWILLPLPLAVAKVMTSDPQPHVITVVSSDHDGEAAAEICSVHMQQGNIIKRWQIRRPIVGQLSMHGDLLCASHGWGLTSVVHMVTGDVTDVAVEPRKKVKAATPLCVLGHVPTTGEYKVLRLQVDELSRRRRQTCEVMTLGDSDNDAGRWRRRTPPPITLNIKPGSSSWNVAVVGGVAYFLVCRGPGDNYNEDVKADSMVLFDLATEEWKPTILQGPLTKSLEDGTDIEATMPLHQRRRHPPLGAWYSLTPLSKRFQLARLGDSLVVVYCNVEDSLTELWFLDDDTSSSWSRRYTLHCTPFKEDKASPHNYFSISPSVQQYHYPLAVLDDGRILVWVDIASTLRAYDPKTSVWTHLATLTGGSSVFGTHCGRLPCSNLGAVLP